jgi:hypothetical protein
MALPRGKAGLSGRDCKSLFDKILAVSPTGSRFCEGRGGSLLGNPFKSNILAKQPEKNAECWPM